MELNLRIIILLVGGFFKTLFISLIKKLIDLQVKIKCLKIKEMFNV